MSLRELDRPNSVRRTPPGTLDSAQGTLKPVPSKTKRDVSKAMNTGVLDEEPTYEARPTGSQPPKDQFVYQQVSPQGGLVPIDVPLPQPGPEGKIVNGMQRQPVKGQNEYEMPEHFDDGTFCAEGDYMLPGKGATLDSRGSTLSNEYELPIPNPRPSTLGRPLPALPTSDTPVTFLIKQLGIDDEQCTQNPDGTYVTTEDMSVEDFLGTTKGKAFKALSAQFEHGIPKGTLFTTENGPKSFFKRASFSVSVFPPQVDHSPSSSPVSLSTLSGTPHRIETLNEIDWWPVSYQNGHVCVTNPENNSKVLMITQVYIENQEGAEEEVYMDTLTETEALEAFQTAKEQAKKGVTDGSFMSDMATREWQTLPEMTAVKTVQYSQGDFLLDVDGVPEFDSRTGIELVNGTPLQTLVFDKLSTQLQSAKSIGQDQTYTLSLYLGTSYEGLMSHFLVHGNLTTYPQTSRYTQTPAKTIEKALQRDEDAQALRTLFLNCLPYLPGETESQAAKNFIQLLTSKDPKALQTFLVKVPSDKKADFMAYFAKAVLTEYLEAGDVTITQIKPDFDRPDAYQTLFLANSRPGTPQSGQFDTLSDTHPYANPLEGDYETHTPISPYYSLAERQDTLGSGDLLTHEYDIANSEGHEYDRASSFRGNSVDAHGQSVQFVGENMYHIASKGTEEGTLSRQGTLADYDRASSFRGNSVDAQGQPVQFVGESMYHVASKGTEEGTLSRQGTLDSLQPPTIQVMNGTPIYHLAQDTYGTRPSQGTLPQTGTLDSRTGTLASRDGTLASRVSADAYYANPRDLGDSLAFINATYGQVYEGDTEAAITCPMSELSLSGDTANLRFFDNTLIYTDPDGNEFVATHLIPPESRSREFVPIGSVATQKDLEALFAKDAERRTAGIPSERLSQIKFVPVSLPAYDGKPGLTSDNLELSTTSDGIFLTQDQFPGIDEHKPVTHLNGQSITTIQRNFQTHCLETVTQKAGPGAINANDFFSFLLDEGSVPHTEEADFLKNLFEIFFQTHQKSLNAAFEESDYVVPGVDREPHLAELKTDLAARFTALVYNQRHWPDFLSTFSSVPLGVESFMDALKHAGITEDFIATQSNVTATHQLGSTPQPLYVENTPHPETKMTATELQSRLTLRQGKFYTRTQSGEISAGTRVTVPALEREVSMSLHNDMTRVLDRYGRFAKHEKFQKVFSSFLNGPLSSEKLQKLAVAIATADKRQDDVAHIERVKQELCFIYHIITLSRPDTPSETHLFLDMQTPAGQHALASRALYALTQNGDRHSAQPSIDFMNKAMDSHFKSVCSQYANYDAFSATKGGTPTYFSVKS